MSMLADYPDIVAQIDQEKNPLDPTVVRANARYKVWWRCPQGPGHRWQAVVYSRTAGHGCPFCAGRRASSTNSLALCAPEIAAQWYQEKNEPLTPESVVRGSSRRVWWKCPAGADHVWQSTVDERVSKQSGCPFCSGYRISITTSLARLAPEVAAEWHPTRNGTLTPCDVTARGDRVVWWQCRKDAEHEWQSSIGNRTRLERGCPFCAGQKVPRSRSLGALRPELALQWDNEKNAPLTPFDVGLSSGLSVFWRCPRGPDHEWQVRVYVRTKPGSAGCPFCSGHRVCKDNCLATRFPRIAREWHPARNGAMTPGTVTWGSSKRVWWRCQFGHEWRAIVSDRTREDGTGCPGCAKRRRQPVATTGRRRSSVRMPEYEGPRHGPVVRRGG